jgi:ArsR family transcriptional regulator
MSGMIDETVVAELANVFLALADKTRLRLIAAMAGGEASVNFLAESVRESQPKVSRHLAYLRAMNVVTTRRSGKNVYYAIDTKSESGAGAILDAAVDALAGQTRLQSRSSPEILEESYDRMPDDDLPIYLL